MIPQAIMLVGIVGEFMSEVISIVIAVWRSMWEGSRFERLQILFGIFAVLSGFAVQGYEFYKESFPKKEDLAVRIQTLTTSLNSAAKTISQIEEEVKQRQSLVIKLQQDADEASKLSTLNKDQLDAVAQLLKSQTESSFWSSQAIALFYAVFGVALSELYRFVIRWRVRRRLMQPG